MKHLQSKVERPLRELCGFRRVALQPGKTKRAELELPAKLLACWDASRQAFVVEPDTFEINVGVSSTDVRLKKTIAINN